MRRNSALVIVISFVLLTSAMGCTQALRDPWQLSFGRGMGGLDSQTNTQVFNYLYEITNGYKEALDGVTVTLHISDNFRLLVLDQTGPLSDAVSTVPPGKSIRMQGTITLNTSGLSKQQIEAMGAVISSADISWTWRGIAGSQRQTFK